MSNIAEKLVTVAEKIPKVYESGVSYADGVMSDVNDQLESVLYGEGEWGTNYGIDDSKIIKKTVSDTYISVDDVSEFPHDVKCKVESVNLIDVNKLNMGYEIDISTKNDQVPSSSFYTTDLISVLPNTQYTLSGVDYCGRVEYDKDGNAIDWIRSNQTSYTFVTGENTYYVRYNSAIIARPTPMLNKGTTALPYTPYVKPEEVTVTRCGRNLLNPNALGSGEIVEYNGVPCYKYTDKNASTGAWVIKDCFKENTQYTFTAKIYRPDGSTVKDSNWQIYYTDGTNTNIKGNSGAIVTTISTAGKSISHIATTSYMWETAYLDLSVSCLYEGTTALPYEPYNGQTLTPATDGTVEGMTSVSPYMNVFSDTEGVNIEATYNKSYGMQTEYDRFWDAFQDYGNRTDYQSAFRRWGFETINPRYQITPSTVYELCAYSPKLKQFNWNKVSVGKVSSAYSAFNECQNLQSVDITIEPSSATPASTFWTGTFRGCNKLKTIQKLITVESAVYSYTFETCSSLENVIFEGVIGKSISFQWCPLTKASITNIINTLSSTATGQTLTLKLSAVNTAFETSAGAGDGSTSAEFAALVATKTNWTITMI